jgi:hypothetical protein
MTARWILWIGGILLLSPLLHLALPDPYANAEAGVVETQRHFRALLPAPTTDIVRIVQTAQQLNYWIRIQTDTDVTYLKGSMPCSICDPAEEDRFFLPPRLSVDGRWFWLQLDEPGWRLHLRPSTQRPGDYELIVSPKLPKTALTDGDLDQITATLTPFGVLPTQTASLKLEPYIPPAKPEPPADARIDSVLFGLTLAPDWATYAAQNGIERSGLRVRVVIELSSPDTALPEALELVIEARSARLVRAQALIHRLVDLARDPAVAFVRLPSRPQPAGP